MTERSPCAWLFGDSIFSGKALAKDAKIPSALRSPAATMNLLLGADQVARAGRAGQPDNTEAAARELREFLKDGPAQDGDIVFLLDVAHHPCDPAKSAMQWLTLRAAALSVRPIRLFMCTAFDNVSADRPPFVGQPAEPLMHDLAFGDRTHNDAVRDAAGAPMSGLGTTSLIELGAAMRALHRDLLKAGPGAYLSDDIHLNVWGQTGLAIILCRHGWPDVSLRFDDVAVALREMGNGEAVKALGELLNGKAGGGITDCAPR